MANEAEIIINPDSVPGAVSTGYQAQNTRSVSASNGLDNSSLIVSAANAVTLKISGGIDVNGTLYKIGTDTVLTLSSYGRFFIFLDGTGANLTPTITGTAGTYDPAKNAIYTAGGKRILNWIIDYSVESGLQIERLLIPERGRNTFIEQDVQPEKIITSSTTWVAPRSKSYKFRLQAKGGDGGDATSDGSPGSDARGGGGSSGGYGELTLTLAAGTSVTITFNTGDGADTLITIGATSYSVQNGSKGGNASASGATVYGASTPASGTAKTGWNFYIVGMSGENGISGNGASSIFGRSGGLSRWNSATTEGVGISATATGLGDISAGSGGGGARRTSNGTYSGGTGAPAVCIIVG